MSIIETIRAEVERRMKVMLGVEGLVTGVADNMRYQDYKSLLSFLSTLEESERPVPSDLEEAAVNWICNHKNGEVLYVKDAFIAGYKYHADHTSLPEDTVLFQKGVEEGKRLMMMGAVDAIVEDWNPDPEPEITIPLNPEEFTRGDKVRIIIVKEKENGQSD